MTGLNASTQTGHSTSAGFNMISWRVASQICLDKQDGTAC